MCFWPCFPDFCIEFYHPSFSFSLPSLLACFSSMFYTAPVVLLLEIIVSIKKKCFSFDFQLSWSFLPSWHSLRIHMLLPVHLCLTSLTLLRAFKCLHILPLYLSQMYFICSDFSWSWPLNLARIFFFLVEVVISSDFWDAIAVLLPLIFFSPVVAVAVTVSTMMTQVPPTLPLETLSVRWWNVTLMAILQVSNFGLCFHETHIGSSSTFICCGGGQMPPQVSQSEQNSVPL